MVYNSPLDEVTTMAYTVKQLSELAGVSVRTLHHYDEIGLLKPSWLAENGYRYYDEDAVLRLQQILFYRELELSLNEINAILDQPDFDILPALQAHRAGLESKIRRLQDLIKTIDHTIMHLIGEVDMSKKQLFKGFTPEQENKYEQEARQRWGDEEVNASYKRWNSYTPQQKEDIKTEVSTIYIDLVSQIEAGNLPTSPEVQDIIARWHQHMRYFYEPSVTRLQGLGQMYVDSPDFANRFKELHPELPEFMREAINHYCEAL
jgi:DNA-binding transcriptional MerR regulator